MNFFCNQKEKLFVFFLIFIISLSSPIEAKKIQPLKRKELTSVPKAGRLQMKMEKLLKV